MENHNPESVLLKRGQTIELVTKEEQGQTPVAHSDATQIVKGRSSVGETDKAGQKADSIQSIENRKFYETKEEKRQFICESFQLVQMKVKGGSD